MTHSHPAGPILSQRRTAASETDANELLQLGLVEGRQNPVASVIRPIKLFTNEVAGWIPRIGGLSVWNLN